MAVSYLPISWNTYHSLAQKLAQTILAQNIKADEIVAISRGGLTLGHLLTDFLQIPISTIAIQSYTNIKTQGEVTITIPLQKSIQDKHVLLVDDVADSGKTIGRAVAHLKESHPKTITTVTMFYKPHSLIKPDVYAEKTSKWILFPYEPTEMILLLSKIMKKEGKSNREIHKLLTSLGYTNDQIAFAQTQYLQK